MLPNDNLNCDVLIVGSGLVSSSFVIALSSVGLRVFIIDPVFHSNQDSLDERAIALSLGSKNILETLNIWSTIEAHLTPIKHIHVSDRGRFGTTKINAHEQKVDALGYVVIAKDLSQQLKKLLSHCDKIKVINARFVDAISTPSGIQVIANKEDQLITINATLLVAADGFQSPVRKQQGIPVTTCDYQQDVIVSHIELSRSHQFTAYERFTKTGPLAMLPLSDQQCAMIWSVDRNRASVLMTMTDCAFLSELQKEFGYRLGKFVSMRKRSVAPLRLIQATEQIKPNVVLLGSAAYHLHPVAGQGLNLNLRDVAALAEIIIHAFKQQLALDDFNLLKRYVRSREKDQCRVMTATHYFVTLFSNAFLPLVYLRDTGLVAIDNIPLLKKAFTRSAMGIRSRYDLISL